MIVIRKSIRSITSVEACDRNIRSKKIKILRLEGDINFNIDIINEILIRKRQISNNSQFTFLDQFDARNHYKEIDFNECSKNKSS